MLNSVAQSISLAIAPVFLLTAIGGILNVVVTRLGRVIDRARALEAALPEEPIKRARTIAELRTLDRRMVLANRAVSLCVASGIFACLLVATLFLASATPWRASQFLPALFIIAVALLLAGLSAFALEVRIATRTIRVRAELILDAPRPPGDFHLPYR